MVKFLTHVAYFMAGYYESFCTAAVLFQCVTHVQGNRNSSKLATIRHIKNIFFVIFANNFAIEEPVTQKQRPHRGG